MSKYQTTVRTTVNGVYKHVAIYADSKKELNQKVAKLKSQRDKGKDIYNNPTFSVMASKWLEDKELYGGKGNKAVSECTLQGYANAIAYINGTFADTPIKAIRLDDFQEFIKGLSHQKSEKTGRALSRASLRLIINTASSVFSYARKRDIPVADFFTDIKIPVTVAQPKKVKALSEEQINMILNTPHRAQPFAMILLFSGLRRSEVVPLRWCDIHLDEGYITVSKSADLKQSNPTIKEGGKTSNAVRKAYIPPVLIDYLKEYRSKQKVFDPNALVVTSAKGKILTESAIQRLWHSYMLDLNIKYGYPNTDISKYDPKGVPMRIETFTVHQLRHTWATLLFLQGVPAIETMLTMGHGDIKVTQGIYADFKTLDRTQLSNEFINNLKTEYSIMKWVA